MSGTEATPFAAPEFLRAVERALAAPPRGEAPRSIPPGALVLLLVEGAALEAVALALPLVVRALGGPGLRSPLVVVASESEARPGRAEALRWLGAAVPGATFVVHDPDGPHRFGPGSTRGGPRVELDDVILEGESLVTVGPVWRDPVLGVCGGAGLVFPGLASRRVRERQASPGRAEEVRARVAVDFQLCWVVGPDGRWRAWAGWGRSAEVAARGAIESGGSPAGP